MFLLKLAHYIEFPNLGWKFPLNDTLAEFELFGNPIIIKWYGVLIAIGYLLAVLYGLKNAHRYGIDPDRMIDVALVTTLVAFIGARLYYVLFSDSLSDYLANPITILQVWNGGLGIYGGIIMAFVFGPLMCKIKKVNTLAMFDIASLGFLIGQSVGRWGNFFRPALGHDRRYHRLRRQRHRLRRDQAGASHLFVRIPVVHPGLCAAAHSVQASL